MIDKSELTERVNELFAEYIDKRIAIYGTGKHAHLLINAMHDYNIVCVLDGKKVDGYFKGLPIKDINELKRISIDMIVVAAMPYVEVIVFDRIEDYCKKNGIELYGIHNGNLSKAFGKGWRCFENGHYLSQEECLKILELYEVICFDVFDTVLMRKTLFPQDVFELVGVRAAKAGINKDSFKMLRLQAELNLSESAPGLPDVYYEIGRLTGIDADILNSLCLFEREVESKTYTPRYDVVNLMKECKQAGKRVVLVSDSCWNGKSIECLMEKTGIDSYDQIITTCDYKIDKGRDFYDKVLRTLHAEKVLFIGDDMKADFCSSRMSGMDVLLIDSALHMAQRTRVSEIIHYANTVSDRCLIGMLLAKLFNSPFKPVKRITSSYDLAALFIAPMLITFVLWMLKMVEKEKASIVLFAARDGYLLQRLYETAKSILNKTGLAESTYFYTSRKACVKAGVSNAEDIDKACEIYMVNKEELAGRLFKKAHKPIELLSAEERRNYQKYINSIGLSKTEPMFFVDFLSSGSCQYFLEKTIMKRPLRGLYLCRVMEKKLNYNLDIQSLYQQTYADDSRFFKEWGIIVLESMVTSLEPSLDSFDEDGKPVFDKKNTINDEYIKAAHKGIVDEFVYYISNVYADDQDISPAVPKGIFSIINSEIIRLDESLKNELTLIDDLIDSKIRLNFEK